MLFSDFESRLTMRAPDGWDSARFLGFCLSLGTFPSLSLVLNQPPVTLAVGTHREDLQNTETLISCCRTLL